MEAAQSANFIWLFPLTFASSAFAPVSKMPDWLKGFASHQPVTIFVDAVRDLVLGRSAGTLVWQALAWGIGILVVFIPLSIWTSGRRVGR